MPPAKDPDSLNKLKVVYAAMPPHLKPEYLKTERLVMQLKVRKLVVLWRRWIFVP